MHLHRGGVQRERLDLDAHDLFHLQLLEDSIQNAVLGRSVHARVDRVPAPEPLRQTAPLATLLSYIKHRVQHLQVAQAHVAALHRQRILDPFVLRFCDSISGDRLTAI
jgi:hypothetical protein